MAKAAHPVYDDLCGWNALLPPRAPTDPASGEITAKYAVVGAGYTGLAAARRLAELDPGAEIVVLEASTVGEGSSARNSGFVSPRDIPSGVSEAELRQTEALNRFGEEGFDWLTELMKRYGVECGLHLSGRIKGAATAAGEEVVQSMRRAVGQLGAPHEFLDREAMRARTGTGYYRCGLFTHEGHLLQPAALIRGLADNLPTAVRLHENSPVETLRKDGKWRLITPQARVTAESVVLATNAAVKHFGYLRDRVVTIYTYAALTEAMVPADAAALGVMPGWGLLPAHRLGTTVRRVGADRLMVRSLYSYERGLPGARVRKALTSCFHRRYPELAHVSLEHVWGGTTALTMNGAPFWGRIDEGLYAFAGCNGAGVVKGTVLGKRLAELIAGRGKQDDVLAAYGAPSRVAPEPFRTIGFHLLSAVQRREAGLEM